jgi:cold shock CspA family protein
MIQGRVTFWSSSRGFRFVEADDGSQFFVHVSMIADRVELHRGERVAFEQGIDQRTGKPCATNVQVLGPAEARLVEGAPPSAEA